MFKNRAVLSLGKSKNVCGIEIKKQPLGAYLQTLEKIKALPEDFIKECFPEQTPNEIVNQFSDIDEQKLLNIVTSVFITVPRYIVAVVAELVGVDESILIEDANIGLDGLIEIVTVFIEVNELGKFMESLKGLKTMMLEKTKNLNTGFND